MDSHKQSHSTPLQKPPWIRVRMASGKSVQNIRRLKAASNLHTVCESALCPNIGECWQAGHATFMIMGDGCTRNCAFCGVGGRPLPLAPEEPGRVAEAVAALGLNHVVVTSVTRDDLADGGAGHFASTIKKIRDRCQNATVEVLVPDFGGNRQALQTVLAARPDIVGHNIETVRRLYPVVRPKADFEQSLRLLSGIKARAPGCITKSGFMVGIGETMTEIHDTIREIRAAGVDILTIGQYLRPGLENIPVAEYVLPETFAALKTAALEKGFLRVESGPLVRSSYRAAEAAAALGIAKQTISEAK
ncbi:MAG: lipoyl synthase [Desulfosalsimonadaceae bacterium]